MHSLCPGDFGEGGARLVTKNWGRLRMILVSWDGLRMILGKGVLSYCYSYASPTFPGDKILGVLRSLSRRASYIRDHVG